MTIMDIRHRKRIKVVQNLFSISLNPHPKTLPYDGDPQTKKIVKNLGKIDKLIELYASKYPIEKISKTDLAILRLSIYELIIEKKNPSKVVINEAVELAKELGGDSSFAFVNGVLATVLKKVEDKK